MAFEVRLPLFEGPFDLLLFFIEKDELDIYDIPISRITHDFLAYLFQLEQLEMEVASEFIYVAATLMRIKAKMLLPRPEWDDQGKEIDPREDLVRHLLDYKRFKEVSAQFANWEVIWQQHEKRANILYELGTMAAHTEVEAELQHLDLYKLLQAYRRVLERYDREQLKPKHEVIQFPYTIEQQMHFIMNLAGSKAKVSFEEIIEKMPSKIAIIFNFLAILDLLQQRLISIELGEGFNNFRIGRIEEVAEV